MTTVAGLAAAAMPQVASAHVGKTLPVATNFTARVTGFTPAAPAFDAKVVDGDQTLWLRVPGTVVVTVPGTLGEPLLRFDRRGVWLNLRSLTAQADRIDRFDLRPSANPNAPPLWHRVTSGHAYAWHEHRLHVLEPLARGRSSAGTVGPWSVPLIADGRRLRVHGVLDFQPPGRTWAWIGLAVAAALAAGLVAARSSAILVALGFTVTALTWALRVGRELYGRPDVPIVGDVEIALTCAVGVALALRPHAPLRERTCVHRVPRRLRRPLRGAGDAAPADALGRAQRPSEPLRPDVRSPRPRSRRRRARRLDARASAQAVPGGGVNARLLAAVLALAAGIAAVVLVVVLLHGTPGPQ